MTQHMAKVTPLGGELNPLIGYVSIALPIEMESDLIALGGFDVAILGTDSVDRQYLVRVIGEKKLVGSAAQLSRRAAETNYARSCEWGNSIDILTSVYKSVCWQKTQDGTGTEQFRRNDCVVRCVSTDNEESTSEYRNRPDVLIEISEVKHDR